MVKFGPNFCKTNYTIIILLNFNLIMSSSFFVKPVREKRILSFVFDALCPDKLNQHCINFQINLFSFLNKFCQKTHLQVVSMPKK